MLRKAAGVWSDADCLFLRPLPEEPFMMGWISETRVNNAVLYMPADHPLLRDYYDAITAVPVRVPWAAPHVWLRRELGVAIGRAIPSNLQKMGIGPRALTYFVRCHHLEAQVSPRERFYPIPDRDLAMLLAPDDREARSRITPSTDLIHASRGRLEALGLLKEAPHPQSYFGQACRRLGV